MRTTLVLACAAAVGCAHAPPPPATARVPRDALGETLAALGYVASPLHRNAANHFEVRVRVNGQDAVLALDTGASQTCIDATAARHWRLPVQRGGGAAGGLGTATHAVSFAVLDELRVGDLRIPSLPVAVLDLGFVNAALSQAGVSRQDGVLGADVLITRSAVIDYAGARLFLKATMSRADKP